MSITVTLATEDARFLGIEEGDGRLAIGARIFDIRFRFGGSSGEMEAPFSLFRAAPLFNLAGTLNLYRVGGEGAVHLGPVVGVMIGCPPAALPQDEAYCLRRVHETASARGVVLCTFMPVDADLTGGTITGFQPMPSAGAEDLTASWRMMGFPLPNVVHNRTTLLAPQYSQAYGAVLHHYLVAEGGSPRFFTKGGLTKARALELMRAHAPSAPFVPPTVVMEAKLPDLVLAWEERLFSAIAEYQQVYLKPQYGSQGEGIYRVSARGAGLGFGSGSGESYLVEYRSGADNVAARCQGRAAVLEILGPALAKTRYLCQKAVERPEVDGFPVDFRAYLTRDGARGWQVCYLCARHALGGAICSHRRFGGVVTPAAEILERAFPGRANPVAQDMAVCALAAATAVAGREGGDPCELAADIALDVDGRPWILEVNDCPNRLPPTGAWVREGTTMAAGNLVDFFLHSAGAERRRLVRVMPT